jgi:pyruvate dehydrogenase (quinone)
MAKHTAADHMVDILIDWGVKEIFGIPGDGINGIMEALRKRQGEIRFVQVRHEESAAFMACGYAKFTGRLGVCLATSGPGGIHLMNGLYDAKMDGQPVLAITGHQFHDLIDTHTQQDVDLDRIFTDVAVYSARVMGAAHVENVTHLACRTALSRRGVAHINFPVDLQDATSDQEGRSKRNVPGHNVDTFAGAAGMPMEEDIRKAVGILNQGGKITILCGRGALGATRELEEAAEILGAPIVKALLGKAAVPDDSPFTTGGIGLLGTEPSEEAMSECDTLLIVGTSFPYIEFYPKPGKVRGIQIDLDPERIALRFPVDVGLAGDCRRTLRLLIPFLKRNEDRGFLEKAQKGMMAWWDLMEERGTRQDMPMKPQVVARELDRFLNDDAIIASDSGTITTWFARHIKAGRGQMFSLSGNLASMAAGLPYALAAQIAYPGRQVVAMVGDGGFSMLMADFVTAVKYRLPIKVVIFKNNSLGQIKWEQMVFLGNPEYGCELQPIDFAGFARACGGTGFSITEPGQCESVLREALSVEGPVVIEAVVDPFTPPMPARIKGEQAIHFAESLAKGEPERMKILGTVMKDKLKELI